MAYTNLSTRSTGYLVTTTNWNEVINNFLFIATSAGLLKHEVGGIEADISAIAAGGILRGTGTGTMGVLASFLDGSGRVTHEYGGIEADIAAIAAGGLLRGTGTGTIGILAKGTGLQHLRMNAGATDVEFATISNTQLAVKAADETVNSSTTLQNDDALVVALSASTNYAIIMYLVINSTANADFKYDFAVPTSPTAVGNRQHFYGIGGAASASGNLVQAEANAVGLETDVTVLCADGNSHGLMMMAAIRNGSNAGNLQLRWAQGTSHADDCSVLQGSWLLAIPA